MNKKPTLKLILWNFLKPYKFIILFIILSQIFWGFFMCHSIFFFKRILDVLIASNNYEDSFPLIINIIKERYIILIIALVTVRMCHYLLDMTLIPNLRIDITKNLFNKILNYNYQYFKINDGQILCEKINDFVDNLIELMKMITYDTIEKLVLINVSIFLIWKHTNNIFSISIIIFIILVIIYFFIKSKIIDYLYEKFLDKNIMSRNFIDDVLKNIFSVKFFKNYVKENINLNEQNKSVYIEAIKLNKEYVIIFIFYALICFIFGIIFTYLIFYFYFKKEISIGNLSLIWGLFNLLCDYLWRFVFDFSNLSRFTAKLQSAYNLIFNYEEESENISSKKINVSYGKVTVDNIAFKYPNTDYLFSNLNLEIKAGEKVAFVGYSGSGKTSLINLILKIFKVESGSIKIDDQNIDEYSNDSIYENISFIPQSPLLFKRSIRENVMYGKLNATEEEFQESLKNASIDLFVNSLEKGSDTIIGGEYGISLSGGQLQRIIIARAFLKNSPILILDEATSSLDSLTEMYIQESLKKLMVNKTVIIVAHRLSTVMNVDKIIVFDKGKIIEEGSHEFLLLKENGLYKKLWSTQTNGFFYRFNK